MIALAALTALVALVALIALVALTALVVLVEGVCCPSVHCHIWAAEWLSAPHPTLGGLKTYVLQALTGAYRRDQRIERTVPWAVEVPLQSGRGVLQVGT